MRNEKENQNPHQCQGVVEASCVCLCFGPFGVFYNLVTQSACNDFPPKSILTGNRSSISISAVFSGLLYFFLDTGFLSWLFFSGDSPA